MIFDRLAGLETEYAVRHHRSSFHADSILERVAALTDCADSKSPLWVKRQFCANGGAFYVEGMTGRILEGATPECRRPLELLTFQRAQERLLIAAVEDSGASLVKNSRDAAGNTYGVQENYEVVVARGWALWAYRVVLVAAMPLFAVGWIVTWATLALIIVFLCVFLLVLLGAMLAAMVAGKEAWADALEERWVSRMERFAAPIDEAISLLIWTPITALLLIPVGHLAFRTIQRTTTAYFLSRTIFTGTGAITDDGQFVISARQEGMRGVRTRRLARTGTELFRLTNFAKRAVAPAGFQFAQVASLFRARQRLQIGFSDANACDEAEYLKIATAMLVVDMAEAGWLRHAPRLTEPMKALRAIGGADGLHATVRTTRGPLTAVQIQRWYAERATAFVAAMTTVPLEAPDVVRRWRDVLETLEQDPERLVGRVDWITKKYLLDTVASDATFAQRRKIDIRYHELGTGYLAQLQDEGLIPRVTDPESVGRATTHPPHDTPATLRSHYVRQVANRGLNARIDWRRVRIKSPGFRANVIRLDDYRK